MNSGSRVAQLEKLIGTPRDGALLRFSLGLQHAQGGELERAIGYFRDAVGMDAHYSAAWRSLGKALEQAGRAAEALDAYRRGIAAAAHKGDKQAEKEMTVFARRLEKSPR